MYEGDSINKNRNPKLSFFLHIPSSFLITLKRVVTVPYQIKLIDELQNTFFPPKDNLIEARNLAFRL